MHTGIHTQSHTPEEKGTHRNHFHGVKSLAGIIDGSMIALHMKYEGKD